MVRLAVCAGTAQLLDAILLDSQDTSATADDAPAAAAGTHDLILSPATTVRVLVSPSVHGSFDCCDRCAGGGSKRGKSESALKAELRKRCA